ncbi:AAA family ATPase [Methylorubrum suomiense]|uniref:YhaN AAA domain-containing protein n=1 Tax=Methylorubrum suomiense TaxID=144191 RepID=A0ABQ4V215_9HYPH|nr:AAA family ATPase [Methylorubrum suomiense]GJE78119.1 hypothetical protein BGCPKDLD_4730 [Methylorubrum suomiense]
MIEQLEYTVRFPPTDHYPLGRGFDRSLSFERGLTAITGANEAGKTLNLELIEFLLFGTAALRGKTEDYRHMRVSGVVQIRGTRYRIERTAKNASLTGLFTGGGGSHGGETLAVGSKPVNAQIVKLLGYGLDVFRVANVANQGDAERLSELRPAERKAMVDKLIGADQIEAIAKWCGEQALGVSREIVGLEKGLGAEPVKPEKPAGYRPAAELSELVIQLRDAADAAVRAEAFLTNPPALHELRACPTDVPLDTLEKADQILGLRTYGFNLAAAEAAVAAHRLWEERQRFVGRTFPQPTLTQEQIDSELRREALEDELARLRQSPVLTCPCGKPFTTADAQIAQVEADLAALPVIGHPFNLHIEAMALRNWSKPAIIAEWERLRDVPEADQPQHDPREAKGAVHEHEQYDAIKALGINPDYSRADVQRLAADLRAWEKECAAAEAAGQRRQAWEVKATGMRETLAAARKLLPPGRLADTEALLTVARVYETQSDSYQQAFSDWAQGRDRLTDLRREERSWRNGKAAMNELREDTKSFLVPTLSRVASYLLSQMTGGARTRIVVDEDFEIEVDGQPLATLSGSGKVCANLALRLGLGRILTNGVFPVFMADEADASMDEERARHLHDAFCALEGKLSQIIIVTHKRPAAPRVIHLEN